MTLSTLTHVSRLALAFLFCLVPAAAHAALTESAFRAYIVGWEGYTSSPVVCVNGETTVGIGHNCAFDLTRPLQSRYSQIQLDRLFHTDYRRAITAARQDVADFDLLPLEAQRVVLSVIWTVGPTGFHRFTHLRADLSRRLYRAAATQLEQSVWSRQVGLTRAADHVAILSSLSSVSP